MTTPVINGILVGTIIAVAQSTLSVGSLKWAWHKRYFYWVWGAGFLVRLMVLAGTAFVVYRYTALSLVATLLTMVVGTTLLVVVESWIVFGRGQAS